MRFSIKNHELREGTKWILQHCGHELVSVEQETAEIQIIATTARTKTIKILNPALGRFEIQYPKKVHYFRGLGLLLSMLSDNGFGGFAPPVPTSHSVHSVYSQKLLPPLEETITIDHVGTMLDVSRNAVFTVERIQEMMLYTALFGMDEFYLYMEDIYEIPEYPYFGYMRGRYSKDELENIQSYGDVLGVETIACIQTLAHLETTLRWEYASHLKDTEGILLVEDTNVALFIERMLTSIAQLFKSKKIHLGMDEAHALGLGNRLRQKGYTKPEILMDKHLSMIVDMCRKLSLEPMIWSDMYIRPHSPSGGYYDLPSQMDSVEAICPPQGTTLVYWDYYHLDKDFYRNYIGLHRELTNSVAFAGGAWTWNGIAPNYSLAMEATKAGTQACIENSVERAICTVWFDNGAETPLATAIPMLAFFATCCYHSNLNMDAYSTWFQTCTNVPWQWFMLLDRFDSIPGTPLHNVTSDNPSKWLLYQDPMLGLFDTYAIEHDLKNIYARLYTELTSVTTYTMKQGSMFAYYATLALVLSDKAELGIRIKNAYDDHDRSALTYLAHTVIPRCYKNMQKLKDLRKKLWFMDAKPFGYEILDIRLSGVLARLEYAKDRLLAFINEEVMVLEELQEVRLPFREREKGSQRTYCACNNWREIVSTSVM